MRLARLVAAGLAVGVITGFVIALLRPRPRDPVLGPPAALRPENAPGRENDVLDIRTHGPVTG